MFEAALWGAFTGSALVVGALVAIFLRPADRYVGLLLAFGGGALISAVAYELLGDAVVNESLRGVAGYVLAGAGAFIAGDWLIERFGGTDLEPGEDVQEGRGLAIVLGKVLDGMPESLVLGISLASGSVSAAFVVALFASNLPMAIGATASLASAGWARGRIIAIWLGIGALFSLFALIGFAAFDARPNLTGLRAQAFAAGAILAMLTNTLMPEAFRQGGHRAGIFTAIGFVLAVSLSIAD